MMMDAEIKKGSNTEGLSHLLCLVHISVRLDQQLEGRDVVFLRGNEHGCGTILRGKGVREGERDVIEP